MDVFFGTFSPFYCRKTPPTQQTFWIPHNLQIKIMVTWFSKNCYTTMINSSHFQNKNTFYHQDHIQVAPFTGFVIYFTVRKVEKCPKIFIFSLQHICYITHNLSILCNFGYGRKMEHGKVFNNFLMDFKSFPELCHFSFRVFFDVVNPLNCINWTFWG